MASRDPAKDAESATAHGWQEDGGGHEHASDPDHDPRTCRARARASAVTPPQQSFS